MRKVPSLAVLLILLASGVARAEGASKVNARQLMRMVETSYEDVHRAAQGADPGLRNKPFWASLDRMGKALEEVGTSLRTRDARFFQDLERGSVALGELKVVWARSGAKAPEVDRGLRLLSSSYRLLRRTYGSEQLRARRGGGLSDRERQRFDRIQTAQRAFASRLETLRDKARERRDRELFSEMERLIAEAYRIAAAPASLQSYLNTLIVSDEIRGEWAGNRYYAEPADKADWMAADQVVEDLYVESQVGHVFTVDLGKTDDWSFLDETTAPPVEGGSTPAASAAIQVYEPSGETVLSEPEAEVFEEEPVEENVIVYEAPVEEEEPAVEAVEVIEEDVPAEVEEAPVPEAPEAEILEEDLPVEDVKVIVLDGEPGEAPAEAAEPESEEPPASPPPMG
ncbi:MAG TPA: hypothetical protein VJ725_27545 [Thermoanaerobaculia bacterium]|nr:hypothetical protein [Thermoanaerobaculia bacterium]